MHDYVSDALSRPIEVRAKYVPNPNKLDHLTTQKANYVRWPVTRIKQREAERYKAGPPFQGDSTYSQDFVSHEVKPRYRKPPAVYEKNKEKLEGKSTQNEDFKTWEIKSVPTRHDNQFAPKKAEPLW